MNSRAVNITDSHRWLDDAPRAQEVPIVDGTPQLLLLLNADGDPVATLRVSRRELQRSDGTRAEFLVAQTVDTSSKEMFDAAVAHWNPTPRQQDVLRGLLEGMSNKEIALATGCSYRTIEVHVRGLLQRASVDTRARLVAKARALVVG